MGGPLTDAPITLLLERLKAGDKSAAAPLWAHYFRPLVRFAEKRLSGASRRAADEEDVALSVLESFCDGAAQGHFNQFRSRNDLWSLLLSMTRRKAIDHRRRERRARQGGGRVRGDSVFDAERSPAGFDGIAGPDAIPAVFAQLDELLESLRDSTLRTIAVMRLEGYSTTEIAEALAVTRRTVERKLNVIREEWSEASRTDR